jgi:hypothetical protein
MMLLAGRVCRREQASPAILPCTVYKVLLSDKFRVEWTPFSEGKKK